MSDAQPGEYAFSVTPTNHPQVAKFTIAAPPESTVTVQFGTDTSYGLNTSPVPAPPGGGDVSILVAGMRAA